MPTEYLPTGESIRYVSLIRYTGPYKVKSRGTSFYRVYLEDGTVTSLAKIPEDNRVAVISGSPNHGTQKRYRKGCRCRECSTAHAVYVEKMATRRISKEETFFNVAALFAQRSTCNRLHTAAVAVDETNNIIAVGYNGSLPGQPHCSDPNTGCDIVDGHCISGETYLAKFQSGNYNSKHWKVSDLYNEWCKGGHIRGTLKNVMLRSVNSEGMIVPDWLEDVWCTGTKDVYKVTTRIGRTVTTTLEHKFLTENGWEELQNINIGHRVALNGIELLHDKNWMYRQYIIDQKTQLDIALILGVSRNKVKRSLDLLGIERRPFKFGGWNKDIKGRDAFNWKEIPTNPTQGRQQAHNIGLKDSCTICGAKETLQVHHKDENPFNNNDNNLWTLCRDCHMLSHTKFAKREKVVFDIVTNIEYVGQEIVYDITTLYNHSFVGDGFILHNCVRTLHAEQNLICNCANHGKTLNQAAIYVLHRPCYTCMKLLIACGVSSVYWLHDYNSDKQTDNVRQVAALSKVLVGQYSITDYTLPVDKE